MKRYRLIDQGSVIWEACQFTDGSGVAVDCRTGEGDFHPVVPPIWEDHCEDVEELPWPRFFHLLRVEDETGNTGTGIVAEGVRFSDGTAALRWLSDTPSFVIYPGAGGVDAVVQVHGHGGRTQLIFREDAG